MMTLHDELKLMTEDNVSSRSPFKTSEIVWTPLSRTFRSKINAGKIDDLEQFNLKFATWPRDHRNYKHFVSNMGDTDKHEDWYARACELYLERLRAIDVHGVIDKLTNVEIDWDVLLSLEETITLVEVDPTILTEHKVIVDLGSGWGRLGLVLLTVNPLITYVACDIPESLIVAQVHLPRRLPSTAVRIYSESREVTRFDKHELSSPGVVFCGTQDLDKFDDCSVDVFVNAFSFQEMTMEQVTEYFDVIDRVTVGLFYSAQRIGPFVTMIRENYPYHETWTKLLDRTLVFSQILFEAVLKITRPPH